MKKLIPFLLAVMLIVAMSVPAFATEVVLPAIPDGGTDGIIEYSVDHYILYVPTDSTTLKSNDIETTGTVTFTSIKSYSYDQTNDKWVFKMQNDAIIYVDRLVYDSTGTFLTANTVTLKSADNSSGNSVTYKKYNNATLPTIDTVWTSPDTYSAAVIFKDKTADNYHLVIGTRYDKDYVHIATSASGSPESYCSVYNWKWYDLTGEEWVYNTGDTNSVVVRTETYDLVWANAPIYTDSTRTTEYTDFFPLPPTLAGTVTGEMMSGVLNQVIAMIPVGLACLIGYLALRKALSIFQRILQTA